LSLSSLLSNEFVCCRRYGTKCGGCGQGISPSDLVRKARDKVFHLNCFTCLVCRKQLSTGEELYVLDDNKFICKNDYLNGNKTAAITGHHQGKSAAPRYPGERNPRARRKTERSRKGIPRPASRPLRPSINRRGNPPMTAWRLAHQPSNVGRGVRPSRRWLAAAVAWAGPALPGRPPLVSRFNFDVQTKAERLRKQMSVVRWRGHRDGGPLIGFSVRRRWQSGHFSPEIPTLHKYLMRWFWKSGDPLTC
jgi:hypothetical protein